MVLSILIAAITAPGLLGSQEAIRQGQSKDKREEHRARRCNLVVGCVKPSPKGREIDGCPVVLRNGKLWIDTTSEDGEAFGHMYSGYYLPYPDTDYEGLVTTITDVAPIINWVYIEKETHEVKYGVRADAQPNLTGPFDCTRQDRRLTFDGWEGWCAVEEYEGYWCLYFDIDDDGLKSKVAPGIRVLEIELSRKEKRFRKNKDARQQDQTTRRVVNTNDDVPKDQSIHPYPDMRVSNEQPPDEETRLVVDAMPKTPPPAYSHLNKTATPPHPERSKNGAVNALEDLLALEQGAAPVRTVGLRGLSNPLSETPQEVTPLTARRATPKLNRNSGSKAIAQAQMFEAMAAAQYNRINTGGNSSGKRASTAGSLADSVSIYSEDDQGLSREIRPHSSVSQRVIYQQSTPPPVPAISPQEHKAHDFQDTDSRHRNASPKGKYKQPIDPAVFEVTAARNNKRRSQESSTSQRKRNLRTFTVQRRGKRVSPMNLARKSFTGTRSSIVGKEKMTNTIAMTGMLGASKKVTSRMQRGRKTTSTFLRDLDDLVSQEEVFVLPKSGRKRLEESAPGPQ